MLGSGGKRGGTARKGNDGADGEFHRAEMVCLYSISLMARMLLNTRRLLWLVNLSVLDPEQCEQDRANGGGDDLTGRGDTSSNKKNGLSHHIVAEVDFILRLARHVVASSRVRGLSSAIALSAQLTASVKFFLENFGVPSINTYAWESHKFKGGHGPKTQTNTQEGTGIC
jgi:hypothetical protein